MDTINKNQTVASDCYIDRVIYVSNLEVYE